MEELQSTEVLDREILEDARKKALRIMQSCEETKLAQDTQWSKKLSSAICELDEQYEINKKNEAKIIMARLPVDKQREKMNKLINLLNDAVDNWYNSLSREKIKEILLRELEKRKTFCEENIEACDKPIFNDNGKYPLLLLENKKVKIAVSMEKMIQELLDEKRYELTEAITGSEFLGEV